MLEIIKFIFSSFWVWLGSVVILDVLCSCLTEIISIFVTGKPVDDEEEV